MNHTNSFICDKCEKQCKDKRGLTLHSKTCEGITAYSCEFCNHTFANRYNLEVHLSRCSISKQHTRNNELKDKEKIKFLEEQLKEMQEEMNKIKKEHSIDLEQQLKLRDQDMMLLDKEVHILRPLIQSKDTYINKLENELSEAHVSIRSLHTLNARLSLKDTINTTIVHNNDNRVQLQCFNPSMIQGKIHPPDYVIGSVNDLIFMLRSLGVRNCFRVNDKSRGTLCWNKPGEGEIRDADGEQLLYHIIDSLSNDLIQEKSYYEEEISKLTKSENPDHYRINEHQILISFCTRLLAKDPELLRVIKKALVDHGKKKGDTNIDNIYEVTYAKFITSITISLFPNVYDWIELSFFDLGRHMKSKIGEQYHIEGGSREMLYIIIHDDSNANKLVNSEDMISYISQAVSSYIEDDLVENLLTTLLLENKSLDISKAKEKLQYLKHPTLEQTKEIMKGLVY